MAEESNPQDPPPAALVESILLDDDSLLSPEKEMPPESPLTQLDRLSPEQLQKAISDSKSMENIMLETSPTREENKIVAGDLNVEPRGEQPIQPEIVMTVSATPDRSPEGDDPAGSENKGNPEVGAMSSCEESGAGDEKKQAGNLFAISESNDDFFDKLQSQASMHPERSQQRTTSVSSSVSVEEAVPVAFEEEKGSGMKFVGSMQNVSRFFIEDAGGNDEEGKSFFDSFTAGEVEEDLQIQLSSSPHPSADATVPVTPPIPSASSPLPSPMHGLGAGPRSRTTSHSSPVHSPILENDHMELLADGSSPFQDSTDIFTHSLNMSDNDRRNDAWIPSEATRQAFINMVTSQTGTYAPDPNLLTSPRLVMDDPQGDPVHGLLLKFLGEAEASKRQSLTADDVAQDETGLRKLIQAEAYRAAIDLTGRLLTMMGQGLERTDIPIKHSPYTLQLWFTRIALLLKLRQYSQAEGELQPFGGFDNIDLFYEFYPENYPGRKGSMVPFAFRILHAELPQFLGKSMDTLDRLYYIHAIVLKIIGNLETGLAEDGSELELTNESRKASRALWERREVQILYSIANCLLNIKDYSTAISICNTLLNKNSANKANLINGMGRIYIQMGDINSAQQFFTKAEGLMDFQQPSTKLIHLMNQGFVHLGVNQFAEALSSFKEAVESDPGNAVAVNNMAVCSLYTGKLREAINTLESLVQSDPQKYLHEGLLFNLCTLYELESSHAMQKKQGLLNLVSQYKSNGFNTACLKMA